MDSRVRLENKDTKLFKIFSGLITSAFKLKRKALENAYQVHLRLFPFVHPNISFNVQDAIADMYDKNNNQAGPKKIVNDTSQPKPHVAS